MIVIFTLLLRKRIFWISVISVMWIILGVTNGVLVATRVTPLTASDFRLIDESQLWTSIFLFGRLFLL